eukprot:GILJ01015806.1.p1 GENE.GILJ01015806.1~~GILJ01015806.1.p1  ORF type:complete len:585 (-),score=34.28 GILJ01015806.1:31-1785(-)
MRWIQKLHSEIHTYLWGVPWSLVARQDRKGLIQVMARYPDTTLFMIILDMFSIDQAERLLLQILLVGTSLTVRAVTQMMRLPYFLEKFTGGFWWKWEAALQVVALPNEPENILLSLQDLNCQSVRLASPPKGVDILPSSYIKYPIPSQFTMVQQHQLLPPPLLPFGPDFDWENLVLAGGYISRWYKNFDGILHARTEPDPLTCDVDLFVYGFRVSPNYDIRHILFRISQELKKTMLGHAIFFVKKSEHVVSIYCGPWCIQVIANGAISIADTILHFDMAHTQYAFDGKTVWTTWSAYQSLQSQKSWWINAMVPVNTARLVKPTTHGYNIIIRPDMFSYDSVVHQDHKNTIPDAKFFTFAQMSQNWTYIAKRTFDPIENTRPYLLFQEQVFQTSYISEILTRLYGYDTSTLCPSVTVSQGSFAIGYQSNHNVDEETVRPVYYEHQPYYGSANISDVMCKVFTPWIVIDNLQSTTRVDFTSYPGFVQWIRDTIPDPIDQTMITSTRRFLSSLPVVDITNVPVVHVHSRRPIYDDIPPSSPAWVRLVIQTINESDYRIHDQTTVYMKVSEVQVLNFDKIHKSPFRKY